MGAKSTLPTQISIEPDKDITYTDIGGELGVSGNSVSQVANRKSDSKRIATALAVALSKPIKKVFPDRPQYWSNTSQSERARVLSAVRQSAAA